MKTNGPGLVFGLVSAAMMVILLGTVTLPAPQARERADEQPRGKTSPQEPQGGGREMDSGLSIRLSEIRGDKSPKEALAPAPSVRLTEEDTRNVLKRLPPLETKPRDEQDFRVRGGSPPPSITGETVPEPFPPPERPKAPEVSPSAPLEVLRYAPEGDVSEASQLSVTFSQPMVALSSQEGAVATSIPVKLSPQPPGHWRWVGTKTLLFEPDGRFPMATEYRVEVPGGTKSAGGNALAASTAWKFKTPPPTMERAHPTSGPERRDPLMFVAFDQNIDPDASIKTLHVRTGEREWKVRLATSEEIETDPAVRQLVKSFPEGRWLAFQLVESEGLFPLDSTVTVTIGPGTASAEGPLKTVKAQTFSFKTYGPLRVTKQECGWQGYCSPNDSFVIQFSNPLDPSRLDASQVAVEPRIPQMKLEPQETRLVLLGVKPGRTTYKVTLKGALTDRFGQTLGRDTTVSFQVGSLRSRLVSLASDFVVLDPYGEPRFSVYSLNHKKLNVGLYAVGPEHWDEAFRGVREYRRKPPGRLVQTETVRVNSQPDQWAETRIDLTPALHKGFGQVLVVVEPDTKPDQGLTIERLVTWVQVTQIGLDAFSDDSGLLVWATLLKDGKPLQGVVLKRFATDSAVLTGPEGLAKLPSQGSPSSQPWLLVATKGADTALLPENMGRWASSFPSMARIIRAAEGPGGFSASQHTESPAWTGYTTSDELLWFVFNDRDLYRPGEEAHVKGWLRFLHAGREGDIGSVKHLVKKVTYTLSDPLGNEITKGECQLDGLGGFDAVLPLPPNMNLGFAQLRLKADGVPRGISGWDHFHDFQVQEFRRPEYQVSASASEGPHFVGDHAEVTASASYYAGGPLPNADVTWQVISSRASYTPPNRQDFTFGKWVPWWRRSRPEVEKSVEQFEGKTDDGGMHRLRMDFVSLDPPSPTRVTAEAKIMDVNRQEWAASAVILVHPAELYVGLRGSRLFVKKGEPLAVQAIVTDIDGKAVANREVHMRAALLHTVFDQEGWREEELRPRECTVRSEENPVECRFESEEGGQYRITATVEDGRKRKNETDLLLWVSGGEPTPEQESIRAQVAIIPDRKEYQPGDTAQLMLQAPFYPAEGLLTVAREGIIRTERFRVDEPTHVFNIPIEESAIPNLYVRVDLTGASVRNNEEGKPDERLPKRPAAATGGINLPVPPLSRKLKVEAAPTADTVEPGGSTVVNVQLRDASGAPVSGGEVALVVVDEAVLDLTEYRIGDPIETFYPQRQPGASERTLMEILKLADPKSFLKQGGSDEETKPASEALSLLNDLSELAPGARDKAEAMFMKHMKAGDGSPQINLRSDFNALALFAPSLKTDADGHVRVDVKMPGNLTRYRVTAVAVEEEKRFGVGESVITVRLPLMVRPSAPRFLNFGDRFELPAVVQNQTDGPLDVDVAVRASNAEIADTVGRRIRVPAHDRAEVRFPASSSRPGTARFQLAAVSNGFSDAAEVALPVWTPATTEAFAVYGELDNGMTVQPIQAPEDVVPDIGGLDIDTSSTQLQALTDALIYLIRYPFECSEQISSRVLAVAALRDVLAAFKAEGLPKPEEMIAAVDRDVKRLQGLQNEDGGFGFWRAGEASWPYVSIHAAHALQRIRDKGFSVPTTMLERSGNYLENLEAHIPSSYGPTVRSTLIAYSLYVRNLMGTRDGPKARKLISDAAPDGLSTEAVGWLLSVLTGDPGSTKELAMLRRYIENHVTEEAGTAHFVTSYGDGDYLLLHSSRRVDGIVLEALISDQPRSDLIPKIVRGLLAHRTRGRWENTQENAFVLLALDKYFATYEKASPDFVVRAWVGDAFAGEQPFKGHTTDRHRIHVPMPFLAQSREPRDLILQKQGTGRLYYRLGMQYTPSNLKLAPADFGFTVERTYEPVEDKDDVRRDPDGTWHIKAGATVRVRLKMVAPARRYHVALVDHLPAGLEALNLALKGTPTTREEEAPDVATEPSWLRVAPWFNHQNLRDDRTEAFTPLLWDGVYTYTYTARATTLGRFVVPPPKAEEMYHPETFGRGATDRVVVE